MENKILEHRQMVADRIMDQTNTGMSTTGQLQKSFDIQPQAITEIEPLQMTEAVFFEALEKGVISGFDDCDDVLEKGIKKDTSHLQKKIITTKTGHKMTVYVKAAEATEGSTKEFNPNGVMQKKELSKEDIASIKGHEHKLSHINRKRYDKLASSSSDKDSGKTDKSGFKQGDSVIFEGKDVKVTRVVGERIYIKDGKKAESWVKASDLSEARDKSSKKDVNYEQELSNIYNSVPEDDFFDVVSQYYEPEDDGESEAKMLENVSGNSNIKIILKKLRKLLPKKP